MFNLKRISASLMISTMLLTSASTAFAMDYTIQRGDTLFLIGQRFGVSVNELRNANEISGDVIYTGQTITIPSQNQNIYTVVRGDSLFFIAQRFGTTVNDLKEVNNLTDDVIFIGAKLVIPSKDYTVVRGDSLFLIAQRNGITIEQLKMANNLNNDVTYPGQVLKLQRGSSTSNNITTDNNTVNNSPTQPSNVRQSNQVMNVTQREIDLLARAVYGESRGEPFEGQVAVAAVILNRVRHREFPNSIEGVVFEPGQFCVVDDGQIWLTPNQSAYRAVEEALQGNDPTGGAIFFYNPAKTNHQWMRSRPVVARIGAHVFAL